ncbi:uncharacterized protein UTRI_03309 [Ustilago trichophora]|uniref:PIN domain-containing protein n=1 Tax=Ustilago trichophora TaxID=86804 RepID=A0A5C3E5G3_9BASI|nr:uncharacterized protein UTRI_03309 [Ustilago trichophora]
MPTYADLYNERLLALGQSGPSNPVRLTISKGDYVWDPQLNRFRYEEQWEEEHLMDHEELRDDGHVAAPAPNANGSFDSRESTPPSIAALQPMTLHGHPERLTHQPSLWVLDTNTLMSCLDLLKALFAALLTRNVAYAAAVNQQPPSSAVPTRPSLIKLVVPYVVVSELDGLKITRRKNDSGRPVASQAREANHWLLSALQKQKRVPINQTGASLSEDLWPLFVQPSTHYSRSKRSNGVGSRWDLDNPLSCDDEIVKFCADLKGQTPSCVCFCSDDTNARTKAELDGIDSLGMRELATALKHGFKEVQSSERKWTLVADALIDQWEYQSGTARQPEQQHHQQQNDRQRFGQQNQSIEQRPGQPIWQSAPVHQHISQQDTYTQPLPANECHTPPFTHIALHTSASEILEVDMDTEEQQLPTPGPMPIPLMSVHPTRPAMRSFASAEGRGTSDSIHSPHHSQHMSRSRSTRLPVSPSRHQPASSMASVSQDQQPVESEALNPQISWEDLVQQVGPKSRGGINRHRNDRW